MKFIAALIGLMLFAVVVLVPAMATLQTTHAGPFVVTSDDLRQPHSIAPTFEMEGADAQHGILAQYRMDGAGDDNTEIFITVYDQNVTNLRTAYLGRTSGFMGGEIFAGATCRDDSCGAVLIDTSKDVTIDGKDGIMGTTQGRTFTSFHVKPNVICWMEGDYGPRFDDFVNSINVTTNTTAYNQLTNINSDLVSAASSPVFTPVAANSPNRVVAHAGPYTVSVDFGRPWGQGGSDYDIPFDFRDPKKGLSSSLNHYVEYVSRGVNESPDIVIDVYDRNVSDDIRDMSSDDGGSLYYNEDYIGNITERLIDGKKGYVVEQTSGIYANYLYPQKQTVGVGIYEAGFWVAPNVICWISDSGMSNDARDEFHAAVNSIHVTKTAKAA